MNIELSDQAVEFGAVCRRALGAAGGDELVKIAEREPARRHDLVAPVLERLGAWDLDPRGSIDDLEAAASACRAAGYWAAPYPVAERLCRPPGLGTDGLVVVGDAPAAPVGWLDLRWTTVTLDGACGVATASGSLPPPRSSAFVDDLDVTPVELDASQHVAVGLVLPCWTLLGMLDRALELTRSYVAGREQFGQPLAAFQAVQFQLADAEVERTGMEELAKYALWSVEAGRDESIDDALALRLAGVEAAGAAFRVAHQLHGAIGFCDETTLSWLSRYSAPLRRLPFGVSATRDALARRLGRRGLSGLFSGGAA